MKSNDRRPMELPRVEVLRAELNRENYKARYKRVLKSTVYALIVVAAVAVLIATLVLPVIQAAGTSMEPTLSDGDILVLVKTNRLKQGDLCAFSYSNKILIKRVIGLPGDYIEIDAEGTVYVNEVALEEPYVTEKGLGECDIEFPYQVPENHFFLLGDHRTTAIDSRNSVIGSVSYDQIIGKIFLRVWPLKEITFIQ